MWDIFGRRELSALRARVEKLEAETDIESLEHTHKMVLTALRGLRRSQQAQDEREAKGEGGDDIDRLIRLRRAR